jgi:alpha,alpha-trehalase
MYQHLAAGAESGWDFTTRWFGDSKTLETIRTIEVIPVDLNSLVYKVQRTLANMAKRMGNTEKQAYYTLQAQKRKKAILAVFWNVEHNRWFDFHLPTRKHIIVPTADKIGTNFYASSLMPIWADASHLSLEENYNLLAVDFLPRFIKPGGLSASNIESDQQWDANVWAPLQYYMSEAIHSSWSALNPDTPPTPTNAPMLFEIVQKWINTTYCGWKRKGLFFEKYDPIHIGQPGGSGEYKVQEGFGWTNGLILDYLNKYPQFIKAPIDC